MSQRPNKDNFKHQNKTLLNLITNNKLFANSSHTILIIITKYAKPLKFLTVYSLLVNINVSSKYAQLQGDQDQDLFVERSWNRNWLDFFSICPCFKYFFLILFILLVPKRQCHQLAQAVVLCLPTFCYFALSVTTHIFVPFMVTLSTYLYKMFIHSV